MDNSETQPVLGEEPTPTNDHWQGLHRRASEEAGPSWSRGSFSKRKQREATDEMSYSAMREIVSYFRSCLQLGTNNEQSSRPDHLLTGMNMLMEMGIPLNKRTIMWQYFKAHPWVQRNFLHLPDEDRRDIIASIVKSQSLSDD
ncbi:hypothetical protein TIFTF001_028399 [Ficus carica]|uniref:Uncharacterized protein n=1 Tax=Ficus carica TaxID=3494 RepID=A0AA88J045_FICCA|nr:hypothetical protein TIFTF001_028399 [Ficus carica]